MPEPTPADALERMRRQMRAVRWRQNLHELQRALYHLLATLAAAATALVVLALLSTRGLFAAAAWGLGAGSVLLAAWLTRALGRRWLPGARPPLCLDRHARPGIAMVRRGRPPAAGRRFVLLARPDEDDGALSRLPGALQERIRQRLWGEDRERAREAMERAERGASAEREDASPRADRLADASDPEERWAIASKPPPGAKPPAGEQSAPAAGEAPGGDQEAARGDGAREA